MKRHSIVTTIVQGPQKGQEFRFDKATTCTLGRGDECCPRIVAPEISRRHCILEIKPPLIWVRDLESTNGTFLNGMAVASESVIPVRDGDEIRLANQTILRFRVVVQEITTIVNDPSDESVSDDFTVMPNFSPACFEVHCTANELEIQFLGRKVHLGELHLRYLENHLRELVRELGRKNVNVNLSHVECIDTAAASFFVRIHQHVRAMGGELRITHVRPYVHEICDAAQLHNLFEISPLKREGLAH